MPVTIRPVLTGRDLERFIRVPWEIYHNDPLWVPPLKSNMRSVLDRANNPFFEHADVQLLLAERGGEGVGRISAHLDHEHNRYHGEDAGFFGFFEAVDREVAGLLLQESEKFLLQKGARVIRGPLSFSSNDQLGTLVDGFDTPPFVMMGHNPPHYGRWLEETGLTKTKDLYAWRYSVGELPGHVRQLAEQARETPGLVIREVDWRHFERDLRIVLDVFNAAWSRNWGFVPFTEAEIARVAKDLKLLLDPRLALIAEVDGVAAAISIALPNLNEAIKDLKGSLFPLGIFKLLWRLKVRRLRSARLALLGVRPEYRKVHGTGLSVLLYAEMHQRGERFGYTRGELSWTLEDNAKINAGIQFMGGEKYKTYRVYEKDLRPAGGGA